MSNASREVPTETVEMSSARIPKEIVDRAAVVARHRGITIGELLGGFCRGPLSREYRKVLGELNEAIGGEG